MHRSNDKLAGNKHGPGYRIGRQRRLEAGPAKGPLIELPAATRPGAIAPLPFRYSSPDLLGSPPPGTGYNGPLQSETGALRPHKQSWMGLETPSMDLLDYPRQTHSVNPPTD